MLFRIKLPSSDPSCVDDDNSNDDGDVDDGDNTDNIDDDDNDNSNNCNDNNHHIILAHNHDSEIDIYHKILAV